MRIVLDAMGSDHAPGVDVEGAVRAARRFGEEIILVGHEEQIERQLARYETEGLPLSVVQASQVIEMGEHPSQAVKSKPDSSMVVGMKLVHDGQADAFVSAGNSGGIMAAALIGEGRVGRIEGILRPALATLIPTMDSPCLMLDIGVNADCRPEWLVQFALMGSVYAQKLLGVERPKVALLANGEEETKGNAIVQQAHQMLKGLTLNFVGNAEGKDLTRGIAHVIVCDGFAGNVALKTAEGVAAMLSTLLRDEITANPLRRLGGLLVKPALRAVARKLDYREYGGACLLGVNGVVIIAHGRSDALAIENAIRVAIEGVRTRLVETIRQDIHDALTVLTSASPTVGTIAPEDSAAGAP